MKISGVVLALILFAVVIQTANALTISVEDTKGYVGEHAIVPVSIENASNVGSIDLTILYDPNVLEILNVEKGDKVKGMLSSNTDTPGIIVIGIADSNGINGDGVIARLTFNILNSTNNGSTPITIQNARAYDLDTHAEIEANIENGNFQAEYKPADSGAGGSTPGFEVSMILVALISVMLIIRRRRR